MLNIDKAWEMYNNVMHGSCNAVVLISPLEVALRELTTARRDLELCREALRGTPCTCRPHAVLHPDGTRTNYSCLRCRALGETK